MAPYRGDYLRVSKLPARRKRTVIIVLDVGRSDDRLTAPIHLRDCIPTKIFGVGNARGLQKALREGADERLIASRLGYVPFLFLLADRRDSGFWNNGHERAVAAAMREAF